MIYFTDQKFFNNMMTSHCPGNQNQSFRPHQIQNGHMQTYRFTVEYCSCHGSYAISPVRRQNVLHGQYKYVQVYLQCFVSNR